MVATTPINALRMAQLGDSPNAETAFANIGADLDRKLIPVFSTTGARDLAITSPSEGMASYVTSTASGANNRCISVYDGAGWQPIYHTLTIVKTADTARTSTTTFTDDTHLTIPVQANSNYLVQYIGLATAGGGDIKVRFDYPASADATMLGGGPGQTNTAAIDKSDWSGGLHDATTPTGQLNYGIFSTTVPSSMKVDIYLTVGASSGNIKLQWAQFASNAGATTLRQGSMMTARRMS